MQRQRQSLPRQKENATSPVKAFGPDGIIGEQYGDARPRILALHGWGRTHRDFAALLEGFDAIALDLPGFGSTPEPATAIAAAGYAQRVAPVLDELELPAVLIGHSFGGRAAVALAASYPEKVGGLVLTGVPLLRLDQAGRSNVKLGYRLLRAAHRLGFVKDDLMERARQRYGSADYRAASGVMREILVKAVNETYEEEMRAVKCPVELVWGELDTAAPLAVGEAALGFFEDAKLTVVAGCDHYTPANAPAELQDALKRRLEGLAR